MKIDSKSRSIIKSVSWRVISVIATYTIVYLFTHDSKMAISIGIVDMLLKLFLFYFHERTWTHIRWGRTRKNVQK